MQCRCMGSGRGILPRTDGADIAIRATDNPPETLVGRRICGLNWAIYGLKSEFPEAVKGNHPELDALASRIWVSLGDQLGHIRAVRYVHERVPEAQIAIKINTVLGLTEAVEEGIGIGLPAQEECRAAFGLMVSLVWMYTEILRLLAILRGND